ncbi:response regulator transcription factor [Clostridium paraputrificum]|uniref:response regulator transcription factor n=1 Tax=Clostridium TaxID=1485 RepID=UPI003D34D797
MKRVLIVEDDRTLNRGITFNLEADGFRVEGVYSIKGAREKINVNNYDLIILDVNLPDGNGFDLCKEIRSSNSSVPIIFLTACDMEFDIVTGFKLGGDDYIVKPFSLSIMRERVFAILRRCDGKEKSSNIFRIDNITIDFDKYILKKNGEKIEITPTEFKLLKVFTSCMGQVITRNALLEALWDKDSNFIDEHALTVNINRLRSKIEDDKNKYISTVYGIGYIWDKEKF